MEYWPDAYTQEYSNYPYVRIPLKQKLEEAIEEYDEIKFVQWLELTVDYWALLRSMQHPKDM